ncbi:MAG: sulfotransferase [Winogradskyella sp.]|uniref:sulfotransferase n=1 Tax=Winogradskyella sp. TaxID=1883156 RepID=UPI000F3F5A0F|nr:sulfotransferase [Winogradskyella sp.]RNC88178.1 MAG: sulfotransferase [Winogradskyella sp.]
MNREQTPIIILGMHRSGTSMLSDLLKELGLNTGNKLGSHGEADFFLKLNDWLLEQTSSSWDNPFNLEKIYLKENKEEYDCFLSYLKSVLKSPLKFKFRLFSRLFKPNQHWGFKDPVTCLTLPFWLDIYPKAKVIYITRHGLDVASSLMVRNEKKFKKAKSRLRNKKLYPYYLMYKNYIGRDRRNRSFISSLECKNLDHGVKLWDYYNKSCKAFIKPIEPNNLYQIKYEDLLEKPEYSLKELAEFIGLKYNDELIKKITKGINSDRAYSYRKFLDSNTINDHNDILKNHDY